MNETQRLGKIKSLWNQWNDARVKHPQVAGGLFRELDRNINPEANEDRIVGVTIIARPGEHEFYINAGAIAGSCALD